jgi:hypothetical protein
MDRPLVRALVLDAEVGRDRFRHSLVPQPGNTVFA